MGINQQLSGEHVRRYRHRDQQIYFRGGEEAAWLFLIWATAPQTQYKILEVGFTPTRYSVYKLPELQKAMSDPDSEEAKKLKAMSISRRRFRCGQN